MEQRRKGPTRIGCGQNYQQDESKDNPQKRRRYQKRRRKSQLNRVNNTSSASIPKKKESFSKEFWWWSRLELSPTIRPSYGSFERVTYEFRLRWEPNLLHEILKLWFDQRFFWRKFKILPQFIRVRASSLVWSSYWMTRWKTFLAIPIRKETHWPKEDYQASSPKWNIHQFREFLVTLRVFWLHE